MKEYKAFICNKDQKLVWTTSSAEQIFTDAWCQLFPHQIEEPVVIDFEGKPYVLHELSSHPGRGKYKFYVVREVGKQLEQFFAINYQTWFYLFLLFLVATGLICIASYWSFAPLRQLVDELNEISASKREVLSDTYPSELMDVKNALNQLIGLQNQQNSRYRNAMDDLAHSLKTRLAATNAILDDSQMSRAQLSHRVLEQVSQMDDIVQYHLKRALIGQRGLVVAQTQIFPVIQSLSGMFQKVYWDKSVHLNVGELHVQTFPLNRSDLTELLGNLLENAFRFCISQVRIRSFATSRDHILIIEDDGPGVPEQFSESIFQRGVRADQRLSGTGIGLAVCHDIVDSYEGNIYVRRSALEGAAFVVHLPNRRGDKVSIHQGIGQLFMRKQK